MGGACSTSRWNKKNMQNFLEKTWSVRNIWEKWSAELHNIVTDPKQA